MSFLRFVFVAGALSALAGCPQQPVSKVCPGTGILCPEDMYCGAVQPICLSTACGNGMVDPGEECDDGNVQGGDTCSVICRKESCGNNVLDPNEVCDDGNTAAGDGCSPNCMSKEVCGNGILDVGEVCDDGKSMADPDATRNADGCSGLPITVGADMSPAPCSSTEVCGNGIKDIQVGEVCDDGNTVSGDGCNSDCRSGEGCGNGIVDPGEECDDGNSNNQDDCLNACKTARCGDGVVDTAVGGRTEQCDPSTTGNPIETMSCNIDCTNRSCGDGKVNQTAGEQCDNGVGNNGDTRNCTAGCVLNVCGDGKVDMQPPGLEQCDDGNAVNTDGCSNACQLASCGNSTVDTGEMCDDGNMDDTDACVMCHNAVCGDGKIRAGVEACDDGNLTNGDGCSSTCRAEGCGNGTLDPGEQCDDGNAVNTDACVQGCRIALCGDGFVRMGVEICDDNNVVNGDGCSSLCRPEGCGNGQLDPGEACDDGNMNNGDGCSSLCTFEGCGDGIVNNGESCDGNGAGQGGETATCNADCTTRSCGDAKVNATAGEQCDNGTVMGVNQNANNRDCTAMCKINICTDGFKDTLGPSHFEACDDGNMIPNDGCSNNCTLASCGNGILDPGEQCDDENVVNTDSCVNCQIANCGDTFVEMGVEECDTAPAMGVGGPYACAPTCKLQRCGNGIIDPTNPNPPGGEECDNDVVPPGGTPMSGDGCSSTCKVEFCGDGLTNDRGHEQCDATLTGSTSCDSNCTFATCGDGTVNRLHTASGTGGDGTMAGTGTEQCDPPMPNAGCNGACRFEFCGDGVTQPAEQCDDGMAGSTTCYAGSDTRYGCLRKGCGAAGANNNIVDPGEECDPPNGVNCDASCQLVAICGDGVLNNVGNPVVPGTETCDPRAAGQTPATCDSDCSPRACGDGFVNAQAGEQCDPATGTTGMVGVATADSATCNKDCTVSICGDGKHNTAIGGGEACDNGMSNSNTGACKLNCQLEACGDGFDGPTEMCDNGTGNMTLTVPAGCPYNTSCLVCPAGCAMPLTAGMGPRCGDSMVDATFGEQCDGSVDAAHDSCFEFGLSPKPATAGLPKCAPSPMGCNYDLSDCNPLPTCSDGTKNNGESGVDCGGTVGAAPNCRRCAIGQGCNTAADCDKAACNGSFQCEETCTDGFKNEMETDVDCGGAGGCTKCALFKACTVNGDCLSGTCLAGTCQLPAATCSDGIKNGTESDMDCGGACADCAMGKMCFGNSDCTSNNCNGGTCAATGCGNGNINGSETCDGANLGGATCPAGTMGSVSCSGTCTLNTSACVAFTCSDGVKNGSETAVDCGGSCPNDCGTGQGCSGNSDCMSNNCMAGMCQATGCGNGAIEPGEQCDGSNLAGLSCGSFMYAPGGTLACTPPGPGGCQFNFAGCSNCGNGVVNSGEQCDGANLGGKTCDDVPGFDPPGTPGCSGCSLTAGSCTMTP